MSLAEPIRTLTEDPAAVAALRTALQDLRKQGDAGAQRAGKCWSAALGAILSMGDSEQALEHALVLIVQGLDAWLEMIDRSASEQLALRIDPVSQKVLSGFSDLCRSTRQAMRGDPEAANSIDRQVAELKRSLRALRVSTETSL